MILVFSLKAGNEFLHPLVGLPPLTYADKSTALGPSRAPYATGGVPPLVITTWCNWCQGHVISKCGCAGLHHATQSEPKLDLWYLKFHMSEKLPEKLDFESWNCGWLCISAPTGSNNSRYSPPLPSFEFHSVKYCGLRINKCTPEGLQPRSKGLTWLMPLYTQKCLILLTP